jgi:hypothetical protein
MIKIGIGSRYFTAASAARSPVYAFLDYTNCSTSTAIGGIYYSNTPTLALGTVLYTDSQLTEPYQEANSILKEPSLDNGVNITTDSLGVIYAFSRCYSEHTLYVSCGNADGGANYYTRYNDVLANGTVLYTDSDLITPIAGVNLSLDGVIYSTDSNGVISVGYCNTQLSPAAYSNCTDYQNGQNGIGMYVRNIEYSNPLAQGTKVYSDTLAISEISSQTFVWDNNVYVYNGSTTLSSQCNT